jgi:anti-sigma B factor antagonist
MDAGLQVHLEKSDDVPVVRVVGEIDLATAPDLRDKLAEIPSDVGTVIVDLSEVTFLDSTGLSVLVATWKRFDESGGGAFRLVVNQPAVQRVLDVTGLVQVFAVFPTLKEALQA